MLAIVFAAALVLPPEAKPIPVGKAVAVLSIAAGADLWSTGWAIRQVEASGKTWRYQELAPLGQSVEQRVALQMAFIGGGALVVHEISKRDRVKGKWALRVMVGVKFAVAAWNVRQGLKARR